MSVCVRVCGGAGVRVCAQVCARLARESSLIHQHKREHVYQSGRHAAGKRRSKSAASNCQQCLCRRQQQRRRRNHPGSRGVTSRIFAGGTLMPCHSSGDMYVCVYVCMHACIVYIRTCVRTLACMSNFSYIVYCTGGRCAADEAAQCSAECAT